MILESGTSVRVTADETVTMKGPERRNEKEKENENVTATATNIVGETTVDALLGLAQAVLSAVVTVTVTVNVTVTESEKETGEATEKDIEAMLTETATVSAVVNETDTVMVETAAVNMTMIMGGMGDGGLATMTRGDTFEMAAVATVAAIDLPLSNLIGIVLKPLVLIEVLCWLWSIVNEYFATGMQPHLALSAFLPTKLKRPVYSLLLATLPRLPILFHLFWIPRKQPCWPC